MAASDQSPPISSIVQRGSRQPLATACVRCEEFTWLDKFAFYEPRGPQFGYIFPVVGMQGYFNIKGYGEFDNDARPDGWNRRVTFALSQQCPWRKGLLQRPRRLCSASPAKIR
jgi:hypothetical protein